jgi:hypothetical protein
MEIVSGGMYAGNEAFCGNQEQNAFLSFFAAIPQE